MQSGELKNLIYDILTNTDDVDASGNVVPIKSYKKDYVRGKNQIIKAIKEQIAVEIEVEKTNEDESISKEILVVSANEFNTKYFGKSTVIRELHTSVDIEFSDRMKAALKYHYNERDELPKFVTDEVLDELEAILN